MIKPQQNPVIEPIPLPICDRKEIYLSVLRLDQVHPIISGNKFWKLKYNLKTAVEQNNKGILTFGGAYSNHIYAAAAASREVGLACLLFIRGEQPQPLNYTLRSVLDWGAQLHFISREEYRSRNDDAYLNHLQQKYPDHYIIPEGGTNHLAIKGIIEGMKFMNVKDQFDYECCPVGTGGTMAGIISTISGGKILGFPALKGDFIKTDMEQLLSSEDIHVDTKWEIISDYHFGGYAKFNQQLIDFINQFPLTTDPIYTGKMFYGIVDLITKNYFPPESRILAVHTGGLQGIKGFNERFGQIITFQKDL